MKERPGFMLYFEVADALNSMADAEAGQLLKALMAYARWGEMREMTGLAAFAFEMMRGRVDRDAEAYREKCRKNAYYSYVSAAKRRGEEPVEYEDWCNGNQTVRDPIQPNTTPIPTAAANTAAIPNTVPNTKTNTNVFSKTNRGDNLPPRDDDTAWVLEYLEERKRNGKGGAECRKHTGS